MSQSVELHCRDLLERLGWDEAHSLTAGDLIEMANLLSELYRYRKWYQDQRNDDPRIAAMRNWVPPVTP